MAFRVSLGVLREREFRLLLTVRGIRTLRRRHASEIVRSTSTAR
jgi:hypothetical protein